MSVFCVRDTSYTPWNNSDGTMNKGHNFHCIIFLFTHSMDMDAIVQGIGEPTVHSYFETRLKRWLLCHACVFMYTYIHIT